MHDQDAAELLHLGLLRRLQSGRGTVDGLVFAGGLGSVVHEWMAFGMGVLAAAGIGLAALPPALIAILRARSPWIGSLFFLIYASAVTAAVLFFFSFLGGPAWRSGVRQIIGIFFTHVTRSLLKK